MLKFEFCNTLITIWGFHEQFSCQCKKKYMIIVENKYLSFVCISLVTKTQHNILQLQGIYNVNSKQTYLLAALSQFITLAATSFVRNRRKTIKGQLAL